MRRGTGIKLLFLCAVAIQPLFSGCASEKLPTGLGMRMGAFIPGAGETTDYEADFLLGFSYGAALPGLEEWYWEAGLDFTSPASEDASKDVQLVMVRGNVQTDLHEWASDKLDVYLYLFWGGEIVFSSEDAGAALTSGIGVASDKQHWDVRFTSQNMFGRGNVGAVWLITVGTFF